MFLEPLLIIPVPVLNADIGNRIVIWVSAQPVVENGVGGSTTKIKFLIINVSSVSKYRLRLNMVGVLNVVEPMLSLNNQRLSTNSFDKSTISV